MKKVLIITLLAVVAWCAGTAVVAAQATDTKIVTVNATVAATAKLTLSSLVVNFPDADPDLTPSITVAPITVDAKAKTGAAQHVTLTVLADQDLTSGGNTIAITNITWIVSGGGLIAGTMDRVTAQPLGDWVGSGNHSGNTQTYSLANSWAYATGAYVAHVTYTLTAP